MLISWADEATVGQLTGLLCKSICYPLPPSLSMPLFVYFCLCLSLLLPLLPLQNGDEPPVMFISLISVCLVKFIELAACLNFDIPFKLTSSSAAAAVDTAAALVSRFNLL